MKLFTIVVPFGLWYLYVLLLLEWNVGLLLSVEGNLLLDSVQHDDTDGSDRSDRSNSTDSYDSNGGDGSRGGTVITDANVHTSASASASAGAASTASTAATAAVAMIVTQEQDADIPEEDIMTTFDWNVTDCSIYPFTTTAAPKFAKCGILEFCTTDNGGYGYRQQFQSISQSENDQQKCHSPGPIIRVQPGLKYLLTLHNAVDDDDTVETNIHTHGVHINGDGNSDNPERIATSGQCIHYVWDIPSFHMGGTHWYHPHKANTVFNQLSKGAMGLFIVEDQYNQIIPSSELTSPESNNPIIHFLKNEKLIMASRQFSIRNVGRWYGNGNRKGARINIVQNEWTRVRIGISSPRGYSDVINLRRTLRSKNVCPDAYVIAYDGVYVRSVPGSPLPQTVGGSGRVDIAVRCTGDIGQSTLIRYGSSVIGQVTIVSVSSNDTGSDIVPNPYTSSGKQWTTLRPDYLRDLSTPDTIVDKTLAVVLQNGMSINDKEYGDADNSIDTYTVGQVVEWKIIDSIGHPAHLHVHHMQVVSSKCGDKEIGEFYDTIESSDDCTVRFVVRDYDGVTFFHCHNSIHTDFDMMVTLNVLPGNNTNSTVQYTNPDFNDIKCYA